MDDPFIIDVTDWIKRAKEKADLALRATALDALNRVKELTPVDTGFLRASWQVSLKGEPLVGARGATSLIATLRIGDRIVVSNPVPYAARIEYGFVGRDSLGRNYNQAGRGMMTQTIAELPQIAQRATQRVTG